jgi:uncharacterized protein with ParB-like and HNH nuclease domain
LALTLSAEQKTIGEIFSGKDRYIIPMYQRAYSWDEEQCIELWEDLNKAYEEDEDEGYFLGNIVIAKNSTAKNELEVIDGQQRLITLTLLIKILYNNYDDNVDLENALWIPSKIKNGDKIQRLLTRVFEDKDAKFLKDSLTENIEDLVKKRNENKFYENICFFNDKIKSLNEIEIVNLSDYLMEKVSLLPIETIASDKDTSREKALKIFESINNRGKSLSSSDIFKARIFSLALQESKADEFIEEWKIFVDDCERLEDKKYDIDRIFKIYSYIIRGLDNKSDSEIGLMKFFNIEFFKNRNYSSIMDDLKKIVRCIQFYKEVVYTPSYFNLTRWFQLINEYTNNYPKDALIIYMFKNGYINHQEPNLVSFAKNLVRFCYFKGSTTSIKNNIYKLTVDIMQNDNFNYIYYPKEYETRKYDYLGKLYKGFGLLNIYINQDIKPIYPYKIKRLKSMTKYKYPNYTNYSHIGHTVITDKNNIPLESLDFNNMDEINYNKRVDILQQKLIHFFENSK